MPQSAQRLKNLTVKVPADFYTRVWMPYRIRCLAEGTPLGPSVAALIERQLKNKKRNRENKR